MAGVALVVHGSFLGTAGPGYRWLRRHGTVAYFGFIGLNLLLTGHAVQALVLLGLGNVLVAAAFGVPLKGRVENVTEWWDALIVVLGFLAIASMWWRGRVVLSLGSALGVSPR